MLFEEQNQFEAAAKALVSCRRRLPTRPDVRASAVLLVRSRCARLRPERLRDCDNVLFCSACMISLTQTLLLLPDFWSKFIN